MTELEIISAAGLKLRESVHEVILPTQSGQIAVFGRHAPLVTLTAEGAMAVRREAGQPDEMLEYLAISKNGVVEVSGTKVRVLVEEAVLSDEINEKEASSALDAAHKMVLNARDKLSLDQAMLNLDRSAVRLKVAELKHRTRHRQQ